MSWNGGNRDVFTPYSRIPPIGSKNTGFQNFKTDSRAVDIGKKHATYPQRKRKLPPKETSKSLETEKLLIRRKTYIVLEPLVLKKPKCGKKSL
ncbi:hypothetical protein Zmor_025655 [Zophobas morio]|uniref:Uncharacterized protein n=1 Tax=Zophobas morio TaxID=2755281 RepID=A0AA38M5C0_9CUCU|nr:hypothetical protein Zmor_025655 [Zophobas morio]